FTPRDHMLSVSEFSEGTSRHGIFSETSRWGQGRPGTRRLNQREMMTMMSVKHADFDRKAASGLKAICSRFCIGGPILSQPMSLGFPAR
ncbi:MAG: hypothetical protein AAF989_13080, partial [Planctomycetota bacterium]